MGWKGCGDSADELAASHGDALASKLCPICHTPGHTARACPEKGRQKDSSLVCPSDNMLAGLAKIFADHEGDVDSLAVTCKCSAEKLRRDPPVDANDFARQLVAGKYNIPSNKGTSNGWSASS